MHGTYEANHAMHDCDLMICLGARFDDRVTGKIDRLLAQVQEDPSRYRCRADQQECARRSCRSSPMPTKALREMLHFWKTQTAQGRRGGAEGLVEADRPAGARRSRSPTRTPKTIIKPQYADRPALCADAGPRRLHHHRSRPAPDVGGAALQVRRAQPLDDLRRSRHHGLWPAGGGRRADGASGRARHRHRRRSIGADDDAGNVDGGAVRPADQDLHPQQRIYGHGAPVAAIAAWRALFAFLFGSVARFRQDWPKRSAASGSAPASPTSSTTRSWK